MVTLPVPNRSIGCMADVHLLGYGMKLPQIKLSSSFLCLDKAVFTFLCSTFLSEGISFYLDLTFFSRECFVRKT